MVGVRTTSQRSKTRPTRRRRPGSAARERRCGAPRRALPKRAWTRVRGSRALRSSPWASSHSATPAHAAGDDRRADHAVVGVDADDLVAEVGEPLGEGFDRGTVLRVDLVGDAEGRGEGEGDAQWPRLPGGCLDEGLAGRLWLVQVGRDVAVRGVQQQGGVADAAGQRAVAAEPVEGLGVGPGGDAAALRLQADQPGPGGGDADRAGAVRSQRSCDHARRDGRRRATAGAAGGVVGVPGVAGGAVKRRLGEVPLAHLGRVGLADHDRARLADAAHRLGVAHRGPTAAAAERGRVAAEVDVVLDRDRHSEQGSPQAFAQAAVRLLRCGHSFLGADHAERIEHALGLPRPHKGCLDQLHG